MQSSSNDGFNHKLRRWVMTNAVHHELSRPEVTTCFDLNIKALDKLFLRIGTCYQEDKEDYKARRIAHLADNPEQSSPSLSGRLNKWNPLNWNVKTVVTVAKVVGAGAIVLGSGLMAYFRATAPVVPTSGNTYELTGIADTQAFAARTELRQHVVTCLQSSEYTSPEYRSCLVVDDFMGKTDALPSTIAKIDTMVDQWKPRPPSLFGSTITTIMDKFSSWQSPEADLSEIDAPVKPVSETLLSQILAPALPENMRSAVSERLAKSRFSRFTIEEIGEEFSMEDMSKDLTTEEMIKQTRDGLSLFRGTKYQAKAEELKRALSSFVEFQDHASRMRSYLGQSVSYYRKPEDELPKRLKDCVKDTKLLMERYITSKRARPEGFIISTGSGKVAHFIPEPSGSWTLRVYGHMPTTSSDGSYPYYQEQNGLLNSVILSDSFLKAITFTDGDSHKVREIKAYNTASDLSRAILDHPILKCSVVDSIGKKPATRTPPFAQPRLEANPSTQEYLRERFNDLMFHEMGNGAVYIYYISTMKNYIVANEIKLGKDPETFRYLSAAVDSISHELSTLRGKGITIEDTEMDRLVADMKEIGAILKRAEINLKGDFFTKAPKVRDDGKEARQTASGGVSIESRQFVSRLRDREGEVESSLPLPVIPEPLKGDQVTKSLLSARARLQEIRTQSAEMVRQMMISPAKISSSEAKARLFDLRTRSNEILEMNGDVHEQATALFENIVLAEHAMQFIEGEEVSLKGEHLPIQQIYQQLKNVGLFGQLPTSLAAGEEEPAITFDQMMAHLAKRDSARKPGREPLSEPLFNQAIASKFPEATTFLDDGTDSGEKSFFGALKSLFEQVEDDISGVKAKKVPQERSIPWDVLQLYRLHKTDAAKLPRHLQLSVPNSGQDEHALKKFVDLMNARAAKRGLSDSYKLVQSIVQASAEFSAKILTERLDAFETMVMIESYQHPEKVIQAVQEFTQYFSSGALDRTTIEMMTEDQKDRVIRSLSGISNSLFTANFYAGTQYASPETMIANLEIMTMVDMLMAYSKRVEYNLFEMPQEAFSSIIDAKNPFFAHLEPKNALRVQWIRNWLHERREMRGVLNSFHPVFNKFYGFNLHPDKSQRADLSHPFVENSWFFRRGLEKRDVWMSGYHEFHEVTSSLSYGTWKPDVEFAILSSGSWTGYGVAGRKFDGIMEKPPVVVNAMLVRSNANYGHIRNIVDIAYYTERAGFPLVSQYTSLTPSYDYNMPYDVNTVSDNVFSEASASIKEGYRYSLIPQLGLPLTVPLDALDMGVKVTEALLKAVGAQAAAYLPVIDRNKGTAIKSVMPGLTSEKFSVSGLPDGIERRHGWTQMEGAIEGKDPVNEVRALYRTPFDDLRVPGEQLPDLLGRAIHDENLKVEQEWGEGVGKSTHDNIEITSMRAEPELQIQRLISYLKKNPIWLRSPIGKLEFDSLLWDSTLLLRELSHAENGPKLVEEFNRILINQYKETKEADRLFIVDTAIRFAHYCDAAREIGGLELVIPKQMHELIEKPKKMLQNTKISPSERSSYAMLRALNFLRKGHLETADEVIEFVNAIVIHRSVAPVPSHNEQHITRQIELLLHRFGYQIKEFVEKDPSIINRMLKGVVDTKDLALAPTKANPYLFSDPKGLVAFDPLRAELTIRGKEGVVLPAEVMSSANYRMIHGNKQYRGKALGVNTYGFTDIKGDEYFMQKKAAGDPWTLYRKFPDSEGKFRIVTEKQSEIQISSKLDYQFMWHCAEGHEVRLMDRNGDLAYKVMLDPAAKPVLNEEGKLINKERVMGIYNREGYQLGDVDDQAYGWVSQFEASEHAQVWLHPQTKTAVQISFPRMDLSFNLSEKGWCIGQWCLAPTQYNPMIPGERNFLRLENPNGVSRIVIPRQMFSSQINPLSSQLSFDRLLDDKSKQEVLVYDRQPGGEFKGLNDEANLYLAMLKYAHRDYVGATQALKAYTSVKALSASEEEIIDWIVRDASSSKVSGQASVVGLLAAETKQKNFQSFHPIHQKSYRIPYELRTRYEKATGVSTWSHPTKPAALAPLRAETIPAYMPMITEGDLYEWVTRKEDREALLAKGVRVSDEQAPFYESLPEGAKAMLRDADRGVSLFEQSRDQGTYALRGWTSRWALGGKRVELEKQLKKFKGEMESLRLDILLLANPPPQSKAALGKFFLQIESGARHFVDFESVATAFVGNNLRDYQKLNPDITEEGAKRLDQALQRFMDLAPYLNHQQRIIKAIRLIEDSSSSKDSQLIKDLVADIRAGRQYDPASADSRTRVVLESKGLYYRKAQIESLEALGFKSDGTQMGDLESKLSQQRTGAGKSTFTGPTGIIARMEAGKLGLFVMPEAQLPTAGKEFASRIKEITGKPTLRIGFNRQYLEANYLESDDIPWRAKNSVAVKISNGELKEFLKKIVVAKDQKHPILISATSLRSFSNHLTLTYLKYMEKLKEGSATKSELEELELLQEIHAMISSTTPIVDEAGTVFDPKIDTTYASGDPRQLAKVDAEVTLMLYDTIVSDQVQQKMHFNFMQKKLPGSEPYTETNFKKKIVPILIEEFLKSVSVVPATHELFALKEYVLSLDQAGLEKIRTYLSTDSTPEITPMISKLSPAIRSGLGLVRGQLHKLMPLTLDNKIGVRYGFASKSAKLTVPFAAEGKPSEKSQFSSEFVQFNNNFQAMMHSGIPMPIIEDIVKDFRARRFKAQSASDADAEESKEVSLEKQFIHTSIDDQFTEMFAGSGLSLTDENLEEKVSEFVQGKYDLIRSLIKNYVVILHKRYPQNIRATSQTLGGMFPNIEGDSKWIGMTATPKNEVTYPGVHALTAPDADYGRALYHLVKRGKIYLLDNDPKDLFSTPAMQGVHAVVDACGYFANQNRTALVDAWGIAQGKGTVTIDGQLGPVYKATPGSDAVQLNHPSAATPEKRSVFYDHANFVGTNIPQVKDAVNLVIVDEQMPWGDIDQALGRNRGIDLASEDTEIRIAITPKTLAAIKLKLGLSAEESLSIQQLVNYFLIRTYEEQNRAVLTTLGTKLRTVVENFVQSQIQQKRNNPFLIQEAGMLELMNKVFLPETVSDPWSVFGHDEEIVSKDKAFTATIDGLIGAETPLGSSLLQMFGPRVLGELRLKMEKIVEGDLPYVSDMVPKKGLDLDQESEVEVQAEEEAEVQQEQLAEQEQEQSQEQMSVSGGKVASKVPVKHKKWEGLTTESVAHWSYWQPEASLSSSDLLSLELLSRECVELGMVDKDAQDDLFNAIREYYITKGKLDKASLLKIIKKNNRFGHNFLGVLRTSKSDLGFFELSFSGASEKDRKSILDAATELRKTKKVDIWIKPESDRLMFFQDKLREDFIDNFLGSKVTFPKMDNIGHLEETHLMTANDAISLKKSVNKVLLKDLFDSSVAVTKNFQNKPNMVDQQKPAQFAVIVKSASGEYRTVLVDIWEATRVKEALWKREGTEPAAAAAAPPAETGVDSSGLKGEYLQLRYPRLEMDKVLGSRPQNLYPDEGWQVAGPDKSSITKSIDDAKGVWLVDMEGRSIASTGESLNLKDPILIKSWVQLKVFAGEIDFNDQEAAAIEEWLKGSSLLTRDLGLLSFISSRLSVARLQVFQSLLNDMRGRKEDLQGRYDTSTLGKIFAKLISIAE